ncbi:hypothetical protein BDZ85DRAFT_296799 [Elsinoe ampelina]|uniref:Uncharacterized protein n=1 Tax=Elsinoe ampelina TaxID=302913 RepID=A0A6A6GAG8_9PEZI|nr:hypothetical protein BDZ85DRAFT_296799 [Elsinoe ampelina]
MNPFELTILLCLCSSPLAILAQDLALDPAQDHGSVQVAPCDWSNFKDITTFAATNPPWTTIPIDGQCHAIPETAALAQQGSAMCDQYATEDCTGETALKLESNEGSCLSCGDLPPYKGIICNPDTAPSPEQEADSRGGGKGRLVWR